MFIHCLRSHHFHDISATFLPLMPCRQRQFSQVSDLHRYMWPGAQKGPMVGLMLWCHHLEILNNFTFKFLFVKEVRWSIRPLVRAENIHVTCVPAVPCHILHPWYQDTGRSIFNWQARALTNPLPHFPFEPELALKAKRSSVLRNTNGQRTPLWTADSCYSPTLTTHWSSKGWPRRKEKNRPMWQSFSFHPSFTHQQAEGRDCS